MKNSIINFLRMSAPFLITAALWRLSAPFWNPAGMLAMIPIFYSSFVRPAPWFAPFAVLFCFLIDYSMNTVFFWTILYCIFYAALGFQNFIDITRMDRNAFAAFAAYWGGAILILTIFNFSAAAIIQGIWLTCWGVALYLPITELIKRARND